MLRFTCMVQFELDLCSFIAFKHITMDNAFSSQNIICYLAIFLPVVTSLFIITLVFSESMGV